MPNPVRYGEKPWPWVAVPVSCRGLSANNVKTVKEQTFHKRSTNVTKTFEFIPEFVLSKEIISFWSRTAYSEPNRNNLFSVRQIQDRYQNILVSLQNDIGMFVLSFLTLIPLPDLTKVIQLAFIHFHKILGAAIYIFTHTLYVFHCTGSAGKALDFLHLYML